MGFSFLYIQVYQAAKNDERNDQTSSMVSEAIDKCVWSPRPYTLIYAL
jgi:hypothetical protein